MVKEKKLILTCVLALIIFISIIINLKYHGFLYNLDLYLNSLNAPKNIFLINISKVADLIFDTWSMIIISLFLSIFLCFKYSKKEGAFFSFTIILTAIMVWIIKEIMHRARPLNMIIPSSSFSFPSGHVAITTVFFGLLICLAAKKIDLKNIKLLITSISMFVILFVSYTRIYLNLHWFSDVVGGLVLGTLILTSSIFLKNKFAWKLL